MEYSCRVWWSIHVGCGGVNLEGVVEYSCRVWWSIRVGWGGVFV